MRLIIHENLESLRADFRSVGDQALKAARLYKAMRNRRVCITRYGMCHHGGGLHAYRMQGRTVLAHAKTLYKAYNTWFRSYPHARCAYFVAEITPIQYWALSLVHEAEHVRQHDWMRRALREGRYRNGMQWYSEVEADRAALRAAIRLGWGRIWMNSGGFSKRPRLSRRIRCAVS